MVEVAWCESRFDPMAENGRYKGLMQGDGFSFDPVTNMAQAWALFNDGGGWNHWRSCL